MSLGIREEVELELNNEIDPWYLCDNGTLLSVVLKVFEDVVVLTRHSTMTKKTIELIKEVEHSVGTSGITVNVKYLYKDRRDVPPPLSFLVVVKDSRVTAQATAGKDLGDLARLTIEDKKFKMTAAIRDSCSRIYSFFKTYDINSCIRSLDCFVKLIFISELLQEKDITSRELSNIISTRYRGPLVSNNPRVISATSGTGDVVRAYVIPKKGYYFYAILGGKEIERLEELNKLETTFRLKEYAVSKVSKILSRG